MGLLAAFSPWSIFCSDSHEHIKYHETFCQRRYSTLTYYLNWGDHLVGFFIIKCNIIIDLKQIWFTTYSKLRLCWNSFWLGKVVYEWSWIKHTNLYKFQRILFNTNCPCTRPYISKYYTNTNPTMSAIDFIHLCQGTTSLPKDITHNIPCWGIPLYSPTSL